jgi:calcineurin-like phosphoesterase family protein
MRMRMPKRVRLGLPLALCLLCAQSPPEALAKAAGADEPPRFEVPAPSAGGPLVFVVYGDTRFTQREGGVVNPYARRALVGKIASEKPAAILIGGDLVYQGSDPQDYEVYTSETGAWRSENIPVFPVLGNHEFKGCRQDDTALCLENWWQTFPALRPFRWYSVALGASVLALVLDSDAPLKRGTPQREWFERQLLGAPERVKFILILLHYPPVRDPFYPRGRDEKEVARHLARHAKSLHARIVVVGSHVHNYERYERDTVTYLVSGGGGAKTVPSARMFGELSQLHTSVNYHYIRFSLEDDRLDGTMVRFDATVQDADPWTEPDHFEVRAKH